MLTRHEILRELRRIGVKEPSLLKKYLKDFEHYMEINYGLEFDKRNGALQGITDLHTLSAREPIDR